MSDAKKLTEAKLDKASTYQNLLTVEAHAGSSSTALPRLALLLRKHQVDVTKLECVRQSKGFYISFSSDSAEQKIICVANEARRLDEFNSIAIKDRNGKDLFGLNPSDAALDRSIG